MIWISLLNVGQVFVNLSLIPIVRLLMMGFESFDYVILNYE